MRRTYQRKFNKLVRALNRNIANDDLWLGRFIFFQTNADFARFEDGSGGILYINLRGFDKKTGFYKDFRFEYAPWLHSVGFKIWEIANNFIAEDSGVWYEEPRICRANAVDYRDKVVDVDRVGKLPRNYYLTAKCFKEKMHDEALYAISCVSARV